ncbi:hypothetical protein C7999DRAFT_18463 [Corynascus novoguineensis]|uniref:Uncharacterized protein n=1 Tax=Corynascus novoguineensis TaxID=1126955 RepID=A0AAN7CKV5_9PEZI|nr:hypothetical protein C7999DRAFT_18463 [Corynascus novoguineensis]
MLEKYLSRLAGKNEAPRVWDFIFKNDSWLSKVLKTTTGHILGDPIPCLVGRELQEISNGNTKGKHLILLVNDWGGDVQYDSETFYASLQDYDVIEKGSVILLRASEILLHIGDIHGRNIEFVEGSIPVKDPSVFFSLNNSEFSTQVIYYNKNNIYTIGSNEIGGVIGAKNEEAIRDICTIKLKFRNESPVYRVFMNPEWRAWVTPIRKKDGKVSWTVGWRVGLVEGETRVRDPEGFTVLIGNGRPSL